MANEQQRIEQSYALAREQYAAIGVDVDQAIKRLAEVPISLHCWQGDDVGGFERVADELGGGLAVTGNYPGKARTPDELRADFDTALSLIPGQHRFNLHACYAETGGQRVERNELTTAHFQGWIDWAHSGNWGSISIPRTSPIPERPTALRSRMPTRGSASSGSNMGSSAARSARPSARPWAKPASPMSGSRTE